MARKVYDTKLNKAYKAYRKAYFAKKRQFKKMNRRYGKNVFKMREEVRKKSDFKQLYEDYLSEISYDKKNRSQTAIRRMVSDEAYFRSREQYLGLVSRRKEIKELTGYDVPTMTEAEFRANVESIDWEVLRQEYHNLRSMGLTAEDASHELSNMYFGSP